jgi:hypothetical protein
MSHNQVSFVQLERAISLVLKQRVTAYRTYEFDAFPSLPTLQLVTSVIRENEIKNIIVQDNTGIHELKKRCPCKTRSSIIHILL